MGDVAEGFMFDPAVLAEGPTEKMGAVDLVFLAASGGGYTITAVIPPKFHQCNELSYVYSWNFSLRAPSAI